MDTRNLTTISTQRHQLSEGPVWCARTSALYWVDIHACEVWRWDSSTGEVIHWTFDKKVSGVFTTNTNRLIVVLKDEVALFDPQDGNLDHFCELDTDRPGNRSNDADIAPDGSLWVGTMDDEEQSQCGRLWRIKTNGERECMLDNVGISNTLCWDVDRDRFYFADSMAGCIYLFNYPSFRDIRATDAPFIRVSGDAAPDGSAIDTQGCLWTAHWNGGVVVRYSPSGEPQETLELPLNNPTSCCFGGPDGRILYITTASIGLTDSELEKQPLAGHVLALPVQASGEPTRVFGVKSFY